jgi:septal ring factor EnvC (AmiA/AmiB activator)
MGHLSPLKALLAPQEPGAIARNMRYQNYFLEARLKKIQDYQLTANRLVQLEDSLQSTLADLREQHRLLTQQKEILVAQHAEHEQALRALRGQLKTKDANLKQLIQNKKALAKVVAAASAAMSRLPRPADYQSFSQAKGRLPWPIQGKLQNRFGANRDSGLKWDGVMIAASPDTSVTAVHAGRVVFADWLSGYGLLMIIDHGGGYMSLYAHNSVLLKDVGVWIKSGDTIARSGNTGTDQLPGLYFEIRYQGEPVDPARWYRY